MTAIRPNVDEALRYLGVQAAQSEWRERMAKTADRVAKEYAVKYLFRDAALTRTENGWYLPEADLLLSGQTAERMLKSCQRVSLMVCTLGVRFDALVRQTQAWDMTEAALLDACGSAYVEAGCDAAEQAVARAHPGMFLTDRFSPGYGDLSLALQPGIVAYTDASRRLGITVTQSCLINPSKTVTAFIGLSDEPQLARIRGCAYCALRQECALRRKGEKCEA